MIEGHVKFDELSGRELDTAVARHVFGLEVEERANARTGENDAVCREPGKDWLRVPNYGSSLASSIKLEVELQQRGWTRKAVPSDSGWDGADVVRVVFEHADGRRVAAVGAPSEALCRAALKAVQQA
jgi:hypothetical protein